LDWQRQNSAVNKADETVRDCASLATIKKIKRAGETPALRKASLGQRMELG
jgi:hypothetical protein